MCGYNLKNHPRVFLSVYAFPPSAPSEHPSCLVAPSSVSTTYIVRSFSPGPNRFSVKRARSLAFRKKRRARRARAHARARTFPHVACKLVVHSTERRPRAHQPCVPRLVGVSMKLKLKRATRGQKRAKRKNSARLANLHFAKGERGGRFACKARKPSPRQHTSSTIEPRFRPNTSRRYE
jgi:hypothetical protein